MLKRENIKIEKTEKEDYTKQNKCKREEELKLKL